MLTIYTDGSTRINNKRGVNNIGGYGYIVYNKDNEIIDAYSEQVENTTNNRMELMALLSVIKKYGTEDTWDCPTVFTDSQYALMCFTSWGSTWKTNGWVRSNGEKIENLDLIQEGINLIESGKYNVNIQKCSGHNGIEGNELADKLATGKIMPKEIINMEYYVFERTKEENKALIRKYPWLIPEGIKEFDYSFTYLDDMPNTWNAAFGEQLCADIAEALVKDGIDPKKYHIFQVKEKYGTLRWYHNISTENLEKVIDKYEKLSSQICINCGKPAKYRTNGWIYYLCEECFHKSKSDGILL